MTRRFHFTPLLLIIISLCFNLPSIAQPSTGTETNFSNYTNFDFVPGEKSLFVDDFSKGLSLWSMIEWDSDEEEQKGRITTVPSIPGNWFYLPRKGKAQPKSLKTLPENFTLEYDFLTNDQVSEHEGGILTIFVKEAGFNFKEYDYHFDSTPQLKLEVKPFGNLLYLLGWREYGFTEGIDGGHRIYETVKENYWEPLKVNRVSISRNGSHIRMYINQNKIFDFPNMLPLNEKYTLLFATNLWVNGYYITNVRLATGTSELVKQFKEKKGFVTQNILFEVNSDRVKPTSYTTLKEIAKAINEIGGRFLIVGHTDSDGTSEKNLELSKRRAAAVKTILVSEFGILASSLDTDGKGQTTPIESNTTPQGKANNRRVEFKMTK